MAVAAVVDAGVILPIVIIVIAAWLVWIIVWWLSQRARSRRLEAWARENGFAFRDRLTGSGRTPWKGMAFPPFGKYTVRRMLYNPRHFTAGRFSAQPDKDGAGTISMPFSFVEFELPTGVPHLMVTNRRGSVLARAGLSVSGGRKLGASTEFDDIFTLHCPADYERDALYIFTPDLLAILIDYAPGCELELVDSTAYLYVSKEPEMYRPEVGAALIELTTVLKAKLQRQTQRYRDERHDTADAPLGAPSVALAGLRLGQGTSGRAKLLLAWSWVPFAIAIGWFAAQQMGLLR